MPQSPTELVAAVARLLEDLGIQYLVGGSVVSSYFGRPRTTEDADFVINLRSDLVERLVSRLEPDFYLSRSAIREALRDHGSFNAVSLETGLKVDFFVLGARPYDLEAFRRRSPRKMREEGGPVVMMKSAEDIVLRKLEWYRLGGEVSERQWQDVLGVLAVSGAGMDAAYLDRWAATLGVADLLARARDQVRPLAPE